MLTLIHEWHDKECFVQENLTELRGPWCRELGAVVQLRGCWEKKKTKLLAFLLTTSAGQGPGLNSQEWQAKPSHLTESDSSLHSLHCYTHNALQQGHGLPQPALCPVWGRLLFRVPSPST